MADLNFPKDRTELVPPGTGPLQTGDEYIAAGTTWIYNADAGAWGSGSGSVSPSDLYLSKVSNDTAAGTIAFGAGLNVTGGGPVQYGLNYISDVLQLRYNSQPLVQLRTGTNDDYRVRFTARQQYEYTAVNDSPVFSVIPTLNGQSTWNSDLFTVKPTLTGEFNNLIGLNLDFKSGIAAGSSITANNFYGIKLARTNQITAGTGKTYGVYTEVEGGANYNFYAAGNALNYMKGNLYVDANTTGQWRILQTAASSPKMQIIKSGGSSSSVNSIEVWSGGAGNTGEGGTLLWSVDYAGNAAFNSFSGALADVSVQLDADDPTAFTSTFALEEDEEGNQIQVETKTYTGQTESLLDIIRDLRARLAALEGA